MMLLNIGWLGSVYFGSDERYAWQSYWIPEATKKSGRNNIVLKVGGITLNPSSKFSLSTIVTKRCQSTPFEIEPSFLTDSLNPGCNRSYKIIRNSRKVYRKRHSCCRRFREDYWFIHPSSSLNENQKPQENSLLSRHAMVCASSRHSVSVCKYLHRKSLHENLPTPE
jgi:hypothetical protein